MNVEVDSKMSWPFCLRKARSASTTFWLHIWQHPLLCCVIFTLLFGLSSVYHSFTEFSVQLQANSLSLQDLNISTPNTQKPPRIIHRTYKTPNIPSQWQEPYDSCRTLNPTYEQYFWTDEAAREFIKTQFPWFLTTYDDYPYTIQRVDALRYFLLWHYGGIYIDLDIGCRKPLDPLLVFRVLMPRTWPYGVSNDFMASMPQRPFIMKVALSLQDYDADYLSKYITVFFTTGPMFLSAMLARWSRAEHRSSSGPGSGVAIFPSMMYDTTDYSFPAHYRGSSWHGNDMAVVRFMHRHLWGLCLTFGGLTLLALVMYQAQMARKKKSI